MSNNELVKLYKSTSDSKNKQILFKELYKNLEKEAMKICHYYTNTLLQYYREDFFEEAMQESQVCLLRCIETYSEEKSSATFSTFFYRCLKNHIYNLFRGRFRNIITEVTDELVLDWVGTEFEENPSDKVIDNNILRDIINNNIDKMKFSKPVHKNIFMDYIGFSENNTQEETFASLSGKYRLTRMGIKKICDKYFSMLMGILEKTGDIDKIKIFL